MPLLLCTCPALLCAAETGAVGCLLLLQPPLCLLSMHLAGPKLQGLLAASGRQCALVRCMHATAVLHAPVWL